MGRRVRPLRRLRTSRRRNSAVTLYASRRIHRKPFEAARHSETAHNMVRCSPTPVGRMSPRDITIIGNCDDDRVPDLARGCLAMRVSQLEMVQRADLRNRSASSNKRTRNRSRPAPDGGAGRGTGAGERNRSSGSRPSDIQIRQEPPPGSAWCHDRTPGAARNGSAASPSKEIDTCGNCSWSAPLRGYPPRQTTWHKATLASTAARPGLIAASRRLARCADTVPWTSSILLFGQWTERLSESRAQRQLRTW